MKRYGKYRPSGIAWIGDIPEHWELKKLKWFFRLSRGFDLPSSDFIQGGYPVYGSNGIIGYHNELKAKGPGIIVGRSGSVGEVNYVESDFWPHNTCLYVEENTDNDWKYIFYYLRSMDLASLSSGTAVGTLNRNYIHDETVAFPPKSAQSAITSYLDRKTAEIDDLIAKKHRLIDLLNEEKTAIINHAVTKGLNPDVPMKDSGIPWLGNIPMQWEVVRLKWISMINPSRNMSDYEKDSEEFVTFLPMERVFEDCSFDNSIRKTISELWTGFTYFEEGDVIVAKITPCFENGKGALLENLGSKIGFGSTEFHVLRAKKGVLPRFLFYLTRTKIFKSMGEALMYGAAGQKRVPTSFLEEFVLGLPFVGEQRKIVDYIDQKTTSIRSTISKIKVEISLLQEYRMALISEAVTGKIDVRGAN
ncbi:MAG: hypothetical protein C0392_00935 [Syntrophus sp. (in: bacteria)]|nr:hypothetical protein [Syntrophus sp. (in: bacteria)]